MNMRHSDPKDLYALTLPWGAMYRMYGPVRPGSLYLSMIDIGVLLATCRWGGPVCRGKFTASLSCDNQSYLQMLPDVFPGVGVGWQNCPWLRSIELHLYFQKRFLQTSPCPSPQGVTQSHTDLSATGEQCLETAGFAAVVYYFITYLHSSRQPVPLSTKVLWSSLVGLLQTPRCRRVSRVEAPRYQTFSRRGRCSSSAASLGGIS